MVIARRTAEEQMRSYRMNRNRLIACGLTLLACDPVTGCYQELDYAPEDGGTEGGLDTGLRETAPDVSPDVKEDRKDTGPGPDVKDGDPDARPDGDPDGEAGSAGCTTNEKRCDGTCVKLDNPAYGC